MEGYITVKKKERAFVTFKFEGVSIKKPLDTVYGQGDFFKEMMAFKEEGGTLEYQGNVYDMLELKAVEVSFE